MNPGQGAIAKDYSPRTSIPLRDAVAQKAEASSKLRPAQQNELMMLKIRL